MSDRIRIFFAIGGDEIVGAVVVDLLTNFVSPTRCIIQNFAQSQPLCQHRLLD